MTNALVIGAGPAGLMAAEEMAQRGVAVTVVDAMPSVGRKFLMAGKSGLNLTKDEAQATFLSAFGPDLHPTLKSALQAFGPHEAMRWAEGLDQSLFIGSTGRVFPKAMKASPLLRAWLRRLEGHGVTLQTRWRWQGWREGALVFATPEGDVTQSPDVTVLALGGASWARLGSDGAWVTHLPEATAPFAAANVGLDVAWSDHMARHFGSPVKAVELQAGAQTSRGEVVISARGIEGGGIYALSRMLRDRTPLTIDLLPDWSLEKVTAALNKPRGKTSLTNHLRKTLRLDPVRLALLSEFGRPFPDDLAPLIKRLPINHNGSRPLDEAISTAGGLRFDALDGALMLKSRSGVFAAGEMLDWEAPTGGYLITGCLATGRWAGQGALRYLEQAA